MLYDSRFPRSRGVHILYPEEFCYHVYMPIRIGNKQSVPEHLKWCVPLLHAIMDEDYILFNYQYLTVKHMWVDGWGNRPGWHIDGFGSEDVNYIWSDCNPTEFCVQEFDLSDDHELSMVEMEQQAKEENCFKAVPCELLRLDSTMVHRVVKVDKPTLRTFVKISCSNERYNLKGNARNPAFPSWEMQERELNRNHPVKEGM
jgi:hypothetical protein